MRPASAAPKATPSFSITEILTTGSDTHTLSLILPMLAHMSQHNEGRWVTWLTTRQISKHDLRRWGIDETTLRIVRIPSESDSRWLLWDALARGNSGCVIAEIDSLSEQDRIRFDAAAASGHCQGVFVRPSMQQSEGAW